MEEHSGLEKGALDNPQFDAYDQAYIRLCVIKTIAPYLIKAVSLVTAIGVLLISPEPVERTFALGVLLGTSTGSFDKLTDSDLKRPTRKPK